MSSSRLLAWGLGVILLASSVYGCEDDAEPLRPTPPPTSGAGGIDTGGGTGEGGGMGGNQGPIGGNAEAVVRLGITANPLADEGTTPSTSDILLAELTAYAAGVQTIALEVPFDAHDVEVMDRFQQRVEAYAERELDVMLNILIVDGLAAHRPAATKGVPWDHVAVVAALDTLVSDILDRVGEHIAVVVFSRRADAYAEMNPGEAGQLEGLYAAGLQQVEARTPNVMTGVGVEFLVQPRAAAESLTTLGDALVFSYLPGLGAGAFAAETAPALALDAMIERAGGSEAEERRPIILQSVGYPSSDVLTASHQVQLQQLDAFFAALLSRRSGFPYVNVQQLHDLDTQGCDALVAAQGLESGDPWGAYMCTTGLRDVTGVAKPAWSRFLEAAAALDGG